MSNTEIETDFLAEIGHSNVFSAQNQVVSKKKKVFTEIETDFSEKKKKMETNFSAEIGFRLVGGMHPEMETNFSAEIVSFRLVGGMHPPHPPP